MPLSDDLLLRVLALVRRKGKRWTARHLGISRPTLRRVLDGGVVSRGTAAIVELRLTREAA